MAWLIYLLPVAGLAFAAWLFVGQIVPQIQQALP